MNRYLLAALLFMVTITIFVFQNTALVTIKFLGWVSPDVSLALVIIVAACVGAIITFMLDSFRYFKAAKKSSEILKQNKKLADEIEQFKKARTDEKKTEQ
ncbi:MAG: LapA family protein [Syntrophomonas sp.]